MRLVPCVAALMGLAFAVAAGGAAADGGPAPGVVLGGGGAQAPGGTVRYVALPGGRNSTAIAVVRVSDGRVLRFAFVPGALGIPQVAYDGTTDGLSPDGATIYAIQYLTPRGQGGYRVREIDVASGRPRPGAIVDRSDPEAVMRGVPVTRASAAAVAFTLYARPDGTAFVHALDARRGTAMCIDLPWPETGNGIWGVRLPVAGGMLRLRHEGTGTLATIDLASHRVYAFRRPPAT